MVRPACPLSVRAHDLRRVLGPRCLSPLPGDGRVVPADTSVYLRK
jgi:hypothetical protein